MLRRLLSLLYGFLGCWVLVLLASQFAFSLSPTQLLHMATLGKVGFLSVIAVLAGAALVVHFALAKLPLVRRVWASVGGLLCSVGLALYALLLFGGALLAR